MTHPIPPGSRDILPDEMRELRALQAKLAEVFEGFGYGEVATPTVEFDECSTARRARPASPAAHRFFDAQGRVLAMRSDATLPIARVVANRYAAAEPPFRFFYNARAYRAVRPQRGQTGEFFQAGVELIGSPAPRRDRRGRRGPERRARRRRASTAPSSGWATPRSTASS